MIALPALPWLRIARIAGPLLVLALLVGWLLWTRSVLATTLVQRDAAVAEVVEFRRLATDATVPPAKDGTRPLLSTGDAKAALAGAFRDRDDARAALTRIDRDSKAAKVRSIGNDAALARADARQAETFARVVAPRIAELRAIEPTGNPAADAAAVKPILDKAW